MSVINKMLRDLDSRQTEGTLAVSGAGPVAGLTRGTFSVDAQTAKSSDARRRVLPWLALAGVLLLLAAVGAWWLYSTAHPNLAPALPASAVKAIANAQPASVPQPTASQPAVPLMAAASAPEAAASASIAAIAAPASAPALQASAAAAPLLATAPVHAASATPAAAAVPVPAQPLPIQAAAQPGPALGSAAAQVAAVTSALAPGATPAAATPGPATATAAKQAPAPATAAAAKPPAKADHGAPAPQASAPAARTPQAAALETLAQAQALWNSGSRDAARDMLRDAVGTAERANLAAAPGGMASFVLLVRELCRMELAEGQAASVVALLARLEPQLAEQADIWALRGNAAQRLGRHQESANAYLAALKLRPSEGRWMLGAAVSLAALGQTAAAGDWAEKARAMGAVSPEVMNYLRQAGVPLRER